MLQGFSLGNDLLLVDYTGRLFREGKSVISAELTGILNRLGTTAETWQARLEKLKSGRLLGRFFAASRERHREAATCLRVHRLANLAGCPRAITQTDADSPSSAERRVNRDFASFALATNRGHPFTKASLRERASARSSPKVTSHSRCVELHGEVGRLRRPDQDNISMPVLVLDDRMPASLKW